MNIPLKWRWWTQSWWWWVFHPSWRCRIAKAKNLIKRQSGNGRAQATISCQGLQNSLRSRGWGLHRPWHLPAGSLPEPFPGRWVFAVAQQHGSCQPWMWCFIPSPLHAWGKVLAAIPARSTLPFRTVRSQPRGTSLTAGHPLRRDIPYGGHHACPGRTAGPRAGRAGAGPVPGSPPPCREVAAAEGGSGGCSGCAGAGLRWRQASNGAAGPGVCATPSSPATFPARPARPLPCVRRCCGRRPARGAAGR